MPEATETAGVLRQCDAPALGTYVADAALAGDVTRLDEAMKEIRYRIAVASTAQDTVESMVELRGWEVLAAVTVTAINDVPRPLPYAEGTLAHSFLLELSKARGNGNVRGQDLIATLATGPTQLSRVGRELLSMGLVTAIPVGRDRLWSITPRGRAAIKPHRELSEREQARLFLTSIATAMPQSSQAEWMRDTAITGLRRSGGYFREQEDDDA